MPVAVDVDVWKVYDGEVAPDIINAVLCVGYVSHHWYEYIPDPPDATPPLSCAFCPWVIDCVFTYEVPIVSGGSMLTDTLEEVTTVPEPSITAIR